MLGASLCVLYTCELYVLFLHIQLPLIHSEIGATARVALEQLVLSASLKGT